MTPPQARDSKIVSFPEDPQEHVRRQMAEAQRLANLAPGEWQLWIDDSAERLGIPRATLERAVEAILADRERKARQAKAEDRRRERGAEKEQAVAQRAQERIARAAERKQKQKERAFEKLIELPSTEHESRLTALTKDLGEELATLRDEFSTFVAGQEAARDAMRVTPWDEPVDTKTLLSELETQVRRYVVMSDDAATTVALWTMFAWLHDRVAVHSPILIVTSADRDSGKTTLLGVLGYLTPRPYHVVEATGASVFRIVDHLNPTLFVDEADRLFQRRNDLQHIINAGWTKGTRIPRIVGGFIYHFNPFCPKVIGMKGLALPDTTSSRGIIVKLWPKKPDEKISTFAFADDDHFLKLRRKLLRWSADNAATLKGAHPDLPPGFGNRIAANWKLLLAIADLAGEAYGRRARQAAVQLSHRRRQPSEGVRLLDALRTIFGTDEMLTSDEVVKRLTSDPNSEWCEFRGHGPITKRQVAVLLEQYDIRPAVIHPTRRSNFSARGYKADWFVEVFARCLPAMRTSVHSRRKTRRK
jgi:hypothetical protein